MPSDSSRRLAIFTDLDGTLIDRQTYSAEVAAPRARKLVQSGGTLVFCSSKSWREQRALMDEIGIAVPAIVENGAGLYLPPSCPLWEGHQAQTLPDGSRLITLGKGSPEIRQAVSQVAAELGLDLRPYHCMTDAEVADVTGLNEAAAARARQRDFSETLTAELPPETWADLARAFETLGLQCVCGGHFYTVTSQDTSKGKAVTAMMQALQAHHGGQWISMGIGDSANDLTMLQNTTLPCLVQQIDGSWHPMILPGLKRIPAIGPQGWLLALTLPVVASPHLAPEGL